MILRFWGLTIPARLPDPSTRRRVPPAMLAALLLCLPAAANPSLESLVKSYRAKPSPQTLAPLQQFAQGNAKSRTGAHAQLAIAAIALEEKRYEEALQAAEIAGRQLPLLADYCAWVQGEAWLGLGQPEAAIPVLRPVVESNPPSPYAFVAALAQAKALRASGNPQAAAALLARRELNATGYQELATSYEELGESVKAAAAWQQIHYHFPASAEAPAAVRALTRLKTELGGNYPPPTPTMELRRAEIWMEGREFGRAADELKAVIPNYSGETRQQAQVRYGEALYRAGRSAEAISYLRAQTFSSAPLHAEALYWMAAAARRSGSDGAFLRLVEELAARYPTSSWTVRALSDAGDSFLLDNDTASLKRYYRACFEASPKDARASYCHWKVAWVTYLERRPEAEDLLTEHIQRYPDSVKASSALYFLGRMAERANQGPVAKSYLQFLVDRFPNYYHANLARERLRSPQLTRAVRSPDTDTLLAAIGWPPRNHPRTFEADGRTQRHLERSRLFRAAALESEANRELIFGAQNGAQRNLVGMELSRGAAREGQVDTAIRYLKRYSPDYQSLDVSTGPREYWQLLYPLPYWDSISKFSKERGLDPFLVAGLIRQESEFNAAAISRARAHGLSQVMPATGRELARKLQIARFSTGKLLDPAVNLNMGTHYLRALLDSLDGNLEAALASYNGGRTRVMKWLAWQEFLEPAEFVESIPLTETRGYVQLVLGNAEVYRRLYSDPKELAAVTSAYPTPRVTIPPAVARSSPATKPAAKKAVAAKRPAARPGATKSASTQATVKKKSATRSAALRASAAKHKTSAKITTRKTRSSKHTP